MKKIKLLLLINIIFLYSSLYAESERINISGLTIHEKKNGELNRWTLGLGHEKDFFKEYGKIYYTHNLMLISDSNKNLQVYAAGSESIRFQKPLNPWFDVSIGIAGFVSIKKCGRQTELTTTDQSLL